MNLYGFCTNLEQLWLKLNAYVGLTDDITEDHKYNAADLKNNAIMYQRDKSKPGS